MKFARLSLFVLLSASCTSCSQTWAAFKNTYPIRIMDQTGSAVLGWLGENNLPTDGRPASMQERAREIESRGHYAGRRPAAMGAAGQRMAAR